MSVVAWWMAGELCRGFLPHDGALIPVGHKTGITEMDFNRVIDQVALLYEPYARAAGKELKLLRQWRSPSVNARASRTWTGWIVTLHGGLARYPGVTADSFAQVVCHEVGHHLGGAPKYQQRWSGLDWFTSEGQADYFSTLQCLRRLWDHDDNSAYTRAEAAHPVVWRACTASYSDPRELGLCVRMGMAAHANSALLAQSGAVPDFTTPSTEVVERSLSGHPAAQCRLDTYLQGAICARDHHGEVSQEDEVPGSCHGLAGDAVGLRPKCWFKSR